MKLIKTEPRKIFTIEQLNKLCANWQKVLGLENWEIIIKLDKLQDMCGNRQGCCIWEVKKRQAIIKILRSDNYSNDDYPQDMEVTLVHELLHCMFAIIDKEPEDTLPDVILEQNIDQLSKSLVGLKRRIK